MKEDFKAEAKPDTETSSCPENLLDKMVNQLTT